jgi:hypothetical protein
LPLLAGALPPPAPVVAGDCVAAVPPVFDVLWLPRPDIA